MLLFSYFDFIWIFLISFSSAAERSWTFLSSTIFFCVFIINKKTKRKLFYDVETLISFLFFFFFLKSLRSCISAIFLSSYWFSSFKNFMFGSLKTSLRVYFFPKSSFAAERLLCIHDWIFLLFNCYFLLEAFSADFQVFFIFATCKCFFSRRQISISLKYNYKCFHFSLRY